MSVFREEKLILFILTEAKSLDQSSWTSQHHYAFLIRIMMKFVESDEFDKAEIFLKYSSEFL